jgi:hypothetical protein
MTWPQLTESARLWPNESGKKSTDFLKSKVIFPGFLGNVAFIVKASKVTHIW